MANKKRYKKNLKSLQAQRPANNVLIDSSTTKAQEEAFKNGYQPITKIILDERKAIEQKDTSKIDKLFILFFACYIAIEAIFYSVGFGISNFYVGLRILAYSGFFCLAVSLLSDLIKNKVIQKIIYSFIIVFNGLYAVAELEFKDFMDMYYSFTSVALGGLNKVSDYIVYFIQSIKAQYYLCLIPVIVYFILLRKFNGDANKKRKGALCFVSLMVLLVFFNVGLNENQKENYLTQEDIEETYKDYGLSHTLLRDLVAIKYRKAVTLVVEEEPLEEPEVVEKAKHREFDDSAWQAIIDNETDKDLKAIDEYLISRRVVDYNDKTGIVEGYNLIYIMCESLDYISIDENLTPTLYKVFNDAYSFKNHYTPIYTCGTGDSDMSGLNSLLPLGSSCTYYQKQNNNYAASIANVFKNNGYDTYGFHNWNDQFYERSVAYANSGIDTYLDIDDFNVKHVLGWQSDKMLMEKAYEQFSQSEKYFAWIVTSVMHYPYDISSYYGDYYLKEIEKYYPDAPDEIKRFMSKSMEFDSAIEWLLETLEADGTLDNTVICIFGDHYPFKLNYDNVVAYGQNYVSRTGVGGYNMWRVPFTIYATSLEAKNYDTYISTIDHVPTLLNLFNLNYDPRLYMGDDIFSQEGTVIMNNGDFICQYGWYDKSADKFYNFDENKPIGNATYTRLKNNVKNKLTISKQILNTDYFNYREDIVYPQAKQDDIE